MLKTYAQAIALVLIPLACVTTATIRTDLTAPPVEGDAGPAPDRPDAGSVEVDPPDAGGTGPVDSGPVAGEGEGEGEGEPTPIPTRTGLWIENGELHDDRGVVILRGINHTLWWGWKEHNEAAIPEIAKTGANAIRLVYGSGMGHASVEEQRRTIQAALDAGMIPIPENHDATCDTARADLDAVVAWWLQPDRAAMVRSFGDRIILNIANEWGSFSGPDWAAAYSDAVAALRAAGIAAPIMIDAGGACAQNPRTVRDFGQVVLEVDPDRNVMFSVHMYAYWRTAEATDVGRWNDFGTGSPWRIRDEIAAIRARGLAVVVGEIGWQGSPQVGYRTQDALNDLRSLGVGFLAWSWNQNSDSALDLLRFADPALYLYSETNLSEGGRVFVAEMRK